MHYHGYTEITLKVKARLDDEKVLEMASDFGMRGIVFKSQMWPTMGQVYHIVRSRNSMQKMSCSINFDYTVSITQKC
jgi:hypothetical protein